MNPYKYYLIALIPDPIRNEQLNVGILGIYNDKIYEKFLKDPQKIKVIAPDFNYKEDFARNINRLLLSTPEDQRTKFISSLGSEYFRISEPAQGLANNYDDFVIAMGQVFDRLVKPLSKRDPRLKTTTKKIYTGSSD